MPTLDRYQSELTDKQDELSTSTLKTTTSADLFTFGLACGKVQGLQLALDAYATSKRQSALQDDRL